LKLAFLSRKPADLRRSVRTRRNPSTIKTRNVVRCLEASFQASFISVSGISTVVFMWLYVSSELSGHQVIVGTNRHPQQSCGARYIAGGREKGEPETGMNHMRFRLVHEAR
jgi:hypothetical protein